MEETAETETPPTAKIPVALLHDVTAVLLSLPASQVFDLLTRLRAEVEMDD